MGVGVEREMWFLRWVWLRRIEKQQCPADLETSTYVTEFIVGEGLPGQSTCSFTAAGPADMQIEPEPVLRG